MTEWTIEYDNDVGPDDEYFIEWWIVTNGERAFKSNTKIDAEWLKSTLNLLEKLND